MGDVRRAAELYTDTKTNPALALSQLQRVRHIATVQLGFHHPAHLPSAAVRELLDTLLRVSQGSDTSPLTNEYAEATDDGEDCWDLCQHIALALACLPAGSADFAVPELVGLWRRDRQFYEAVLAAVALSFPEGGRPSASALSASQRGVLVALAGDEAVWKFCGDTAPILEARGLPGSRVGMQSFLASGSEPV
jgi:hypothetical protein